MDRLHITALLFLLGVCVAGAAVGAERRYPTPDFESGYSLPEVQVPAPRSTWQEAMDVVVLVGALSAAAWLALVSRSRKGMLGLSIFSLAYFGFYRAGCICPVGSIQNVSVALADPGYLLPSTVVLFFLLPLLFALFFGRVFCGGVCPLGAMQDVLLFEPVEVPGWLDRGLRVLPWLYLGAVVMFAVTGAGFFICRYDPFVAFFRMSGGLYMLLAGGGVLLLSTFVGRPYCRYACPYKPLLGLLSRVAWRRPTITPDSCVTCSLCDEACPFGAIEPPVPEGVEEE